MKEDVAVVLANQIGLKEKVKAYSELFKLRLSVLVVFSSGIGYLYASTASIDYFNFFLLLIGGFLITGSSNTINQIIERDTDQLMKRTQNRPLLTGRVGYSEAIFIASISGIGGLAIIAFNMNLLSALLGLAALVSYAFIYTPFKKISPISVFIGAFPGALPVLIGYAAVTNSITYEALLLFTIQFMWQFPHFWAIAWVLDEDYKKAGFRMLPFKGEPGKKVAFQILLYTATLIPLSFVFTYFGINGNLTAIICSITAIYFTWLSIKLYQKVDEVSARKLMYGSFIYLPVVQITLVLDKI